MSDSMTNRMFKFTLSITAVLLFTTISLAADATGAVSFQSKPGQLDVRITEQSVGTYFFADSTITRPYIAHVKTVDGIQVTRNHPPVEGKDRTDHETMHPGIWMAFGDLNGTDIWRNKGRVIHESFVQQPKGSKGRGSFAVRNRYETEDGKTICHEVCRITVIVQPKGYLLLWDSTFSSPNEIYFGDQEEMGLGVRLATPIAVTSRSGGRILNSHGQKNGKAVWGKTASWCDYSGPIGDQFVGVTIMPDPRNFRPCWWHARDYGFVAANPFGRAAFEAGPPSKVLASRKSPLRLRFGLFVHSSEKEEDVDLSSAYESFLSLPHSVPKPVVGDATRPGRIDAEGLVASSTTIESD